MAVMRYASTSVPSSLSDDITVCTCPFLQRSAPDEAPAVGARGGMG
jgi:hypothetical protein